MDKGNTGLLLQGVQVVGHAVLLLADVDYHLRAGLQQRFQVQLALAAVQLAQQGQGVILTGDQVLGLRAPFVGNAHHHLRGDGEYHDLGQRTGNGDLGQVGGQGDFPAQRIGKGAGGRFLVCLGLGVLSAAGQRQGGDHHDGQQNGKCLFHLL